MYRGKYCGKSKLRQRMLDKSASTVAADAGNKNLDDLLSSVVPRQDGHHTDQPKSRKMEIPLKDKGGDDASGSSKMKKFYPEEYFRRSGYKFRPMETMPADPRVTSAMNSNMEVERFNEELIYP